MPTPNPLPGNHYFAAATRALEIADEYEAPPEEWKAMVATQCASVVATMALAFEQRTANLIAVNRLAFQRCLFVDAIEEQVFTRLGLDEVQS